MCRFLLLCPDENDSDEHSQRCRWYSIRISDYLVQSGHRVEIIAMPSGRQKLFDTGHRYAFVVSLMHGNDCSTLRHSACPINNPDDPECSCWADTPVTGALSASEIEKTGMLAGARVFGATCCYGIRRFGTRLTTGGRAHFFVGYENQYEHANVMKLFGVGEQADPFLYAARIGSSWLPVTGGPLPLIFAVLTVYIVMLNVYSDPHLDLLSRAVVLKCLHNNLRTLDGHVLGGMYSALESYHDRGGLLNRAVGNGLAIK